MGWIVDKSTCRTVDMSTDREAERKGGRGTENDTRFRPGLKQCPMYAQIGKGTGKWSTEQGCGWWIRRAQQHWGGFWRPISIGTDCGFDDRRATQSRWGDGEKAAVWSDLREPESEL